MPKSLKSAGSRVVAAHPNGGKSVPLEGIIGIPDRYESARVEPPSIPQPAEGTEEEPPVLTAAHPEKVELNADEIADRAYCISEVRQRTGQAGDAVSDWLRAEQELIAERRASNS